MPNDWRAQTEQIADLPVEDRIDLICDWYEVHLRAGGASDLAPYLDFCDASDRARLFVELVLVDAELRDRNRQQPTDWSLYQSQFPEFSEQIEEARLKFHAADPADCVANASPIEWERIGHFELHQRIGAGAAGEVWQAHDPRLQRTVAIKIPRTRSLADAELERFLREGRAAAQLSHPGIIPVYEVGRDQNTAYIVSAYVAGQNLREWLRHRRPTHRDAAELARRLADALHHAHEQGVVHRDLKPSNVIMDDNGLPHITDFGLAKLASSGHDMTLDGELLGTPAYMSPEQASGRASAADPRTDVYALGVILYELVTGRCPFEGDQRVLVHKIIHDEPPAPRGIERGIPRDLETICLKAMHKIPAHRYRTAQEMAVDLQRFLDGDPILARRPGLLESGWRWARRRPALVSAVALGLVALGAAGIATKLSDDNRALVGWHTVTLATQPAGARVVFVPLDAGTGEPVADQAIRPRDRSPVQVELKPGDYLVVVALDDGRFHEVYRHVPRGTENLPGTFSHARWDVGEKGEILLPKIWIPRKNIESTMAFLPGTSRRRSTTDVAESRGFYMDYHEFTVAEYKRLTEGGPPRDTRWHRVPDSYAVTLSWDEAVTRAEDVGKRLPSEAEFEQALANIDTAAQNLPSGAADGSQSFGPVGTPATDHTSTNPPIFGLLSNVAEWTSSAAVHPSLAATEVEIPFLSVMGARVVRGGDLTVIFGNPTAPGATYEPNSRAGMPREALQPGLGFRCVRSAVPRYLDD